MAVTKWRVSGGALGRVIDTDFDTREEAEDFVKCLYARGSEHLARMPERVAIERVEITTVIEYGRPPITGAEL